ncbi:S-adenosyl-L-methionine-dependent methyltransferase [Pseudomassariella vexata]|uniref:S-adenosyl-L-methionine-dependent methyltransferase n=1 Tax=Pseudomassariella vexata TaxID=1141098 RepID=A0A1Y2DHN0_9PEZI|nr:S-adenosyl-L-methionine-dependent methyltransferase [Pseudomassariella vexata]ORY58752.1 S-adenosyl-L-methionine-dependent methyltransferase [Pseudomassariella vexata]
MAENPTNPFAKSGGVNAGVGGPADTKPRFPPVTLPSKIQSHNSHHPIMAPGHAMASGIDPQSSNTGLVNTSHLIAPAQPYRQPQDEEYQHTGSTIPDPIAVWENGRSFHGYKEGKYFFPNDAKEQDRLDLQHKLWTMALDNSLGWAPVGDAPSNVLHVGTGTGIWAVDFAEEHPLSNVIGTDLSLIQPPNKPENCHFFLDDIEEEWIFEMPFDNVHLRLMVSCFNRPKDVMAKILDHLRPGGWVEYHDTVFDLSCVDDTMQGTALRRWCDLMIAGAANLGRNLNVTKQYKDWMVELGFVDIIEKKVACPGNSWPVDPHQRELGRWQAVNTTSSIQGISLRVLQKGLGMSVDAINELSKQVQADACNRNIHWYCT